MRAIDQFYLAQAEPIKSCLVALREIILQQDNDVTETWKYGMPFFCFKGKNVLLPVDTQKAAATLYRNRGRETYKPPNALERKTIPNENHAIRPYRGFAD